MFARFVNQKIFKNNVQMLRGSFEYYPPHSKKPIILGLASHNHTRLASIPSQLLACILLHEDIGFFRHGGINWPEVRRRIAGYLTGTGGRAAGSSITQQFARHIFRYNNASILRKLPEFFLSVELEESYSKEELLELHLSSIFLGHKRIYGIEEAARRYFRKQLYELSLEESMYIAQLIQTPVRCQQKVLRQKNLSNFNFNLSFVKFRDLFLFYYYGFSPEAVENVEDVKVDELISRLKVKTLLYPSGVDKSVYFALENRALFHTHKLRELVASLFDRTEDIINPQR